MYIAFPLVKRLGRKTNRILRRNADCCIACIVYYVLLLNCTRYNTAIIFHLTAHFRLYQKKNPSDFEESAAADAKYIIFSTKRLNASYYNNKNS